MACSSPGAKISPRASKPPGARSSASCMHCSGPFCRLAWTMAAVTGRRRDSYSVSAAAMEGAFTRATPRPAASRMAWLAPLDPMGYMGWAASPRSVTAPSLQLGSGSRSTMGNSSTSSAWAIRAGTSSQGKCQLANSPAKRARSTGLFQSSRSPVQGRRSSAIQLIRWRPSPRGGSMG